MGLFNKAIELTKEDYDKINAILPPELRKERWEYSEITEGGLLRKFREFRDLTETQLNDCSVKQDEILRAIKSKKENSEQFIISKIPIFNTEIYEAKPLGMVDVGIVKRFGTASTGNRFENGIAGYAIEGAIDKVWSENNTQFAAVQSAKLELLMEATKSHKDCNSIFKFEIDFRELGSSGNVFIYARGTACIGNYKNIEILKEEFQKEVTNSENELDFIKSKCKELKSKYEKLGRNWNIPENKNDLKKLLEK